VPSSARLTHWVQARWNGSVGDSLSKNGIKDRYHLGCFSRCLTWSLGSRFLLAPGVPGDYT
jgi:hypothetical protein